MKTITRSRVDGDGRFPAAGRAAVHGELGAQLAEHRVRSAADAGQIEAATVVTNVPPMPRLQRIKLALKRAYLRTKLLKFRALRLVLGVKIDVALFQCRVFGRDEPKSLLENRRRAMFVDEFFKQLKHGARS